MCGKFLPLLSKQYAVWWWEVVVCSAFCHLVDCFVGVDVVLRECPIFDVFLHLPPVCVALFVGCLVLLVVVVTWVVVKVGRDPCTSDSPMLCGFDVMDELLP